MRLSNSELHLWLLWSSFSVSFRIIDVQSVTIAAFFRFFTIIKMKFGSKLSRHFIRLRYGRFVLETTRSLIITVFVRYGIDISNACLGCIKKSGEPVKIGEEYSEDNCSRLCVCTSNGIQCRPVCPDTIFNLLQKCDLPKSLKLIRVPAGPERLDCFCWIVKCVPPGIGKDSTFASRPSPRVQQCT